MQATSATWKTLAAKLATGGAILETKALIGGGQQYTEYTDISTPVINRALMQNGLSVGNAVSATCNFSVLSPQTIPKAATVKLKMRLTDGTANSEWLPAGTYYLSHRRVDPVSGLVDIECYDALLKANAIWPELEPLTDHTLSAITDQNGNTIDVTSNWDTRSMESVMVRVLDLLDVELDSRTTIQTGSGFEVTTLTANTTINSILSGIAAVHGGNWIMTPEGKLRLVQLKSASGAASASEDVVDVAGIINSVSINGSGTITGFRVDNNEKISLVGSDTGIVIDINTPYITNAAIQWLTGWLIGQTYQAYNADGAIYDPAAELGDYLRSRNDIASMLYSEAATLGIACRFNASAPEPGELSDEYPYIGVRTRADSSAKVYAAQAANAAEDNAKAYASEAASTAESNANAYAAQSISEAEINITMFASDAAATAEANANEYADKAIQRSMDMLTQQEVFDRLTDNGASGGLALELLYPGAASKLIHIDGGRVDRGTIADGWGNNMWILDNGPGDGIFIHNVGTIGLFIVDNGKLTYSDTDGSADFSKDALVYKFNQSTGASDDGLYGIDYSGRSIRFEFQNQDVGEIKANGTGLVCNTDYTVEGDFVATGAKSRAVDTKDYGCRKLYAYETAEPLFGDLGEGVIGDDGKCTVLLDPVFVQTISGGVYQVSLQAYSPGDSYVASRKADRFTVVGTPGTKFGWEVKAKQIGLSKIRLECVNNTREGVKNVNDT